MKDLGYQNVHCAHGFRATAKTILQEQLKYPLVLVQNFGRMSTNYTIPLNTNEKSQLIQSLSSVEMLQNFYMETFIPYEYMVANDFTFSYLYYDQDRQPLTRIIMNQDTCHEALN